MCAAVQTPLSHQGREREKEEASMRKRGHWGGSKPFGGTPKGATGTVALPKPEAPDEGGKLGAGRPRSPTHVSLALKAGARSRGRRLDRNRCARSHIEAGRGG